MHHPRESHSSPALNHHSCGSQASPFSPFFLFPPNYSSHFTIITIMGSKVSKPSEPEPQLYAVATPHPTMKWIYPVYAAPMDAGPPPQQEKKGRSSPLAWIGGEKSTKSRNDIPVVAEHHERIPIPDGASINEDGTWYHFHVDAGGAVDYIRPGTTLPNTFAEAAPYAPRTFEGSMTPSMSMAGVPYEESYYSYPASPAYQGYHHPQPQRVVPAHSEVYSVGSAHHYQHHPRARSVSPSHARAMTPTNLKPRRATTPTPKRSRTPNYEPAPPIPEHIAPVPVHSRRTVTPFPNRRALPPPSSTSYSPRTIDSRNGYVVDDREYRVLEEQQREYRAESREQRNEYRDRDPRAVAYAASPNSGRTSRTSPRHHQIPDDDTTAIASPDNGSVVVKSVQSRPYSPNPPSEPAFYGNVVDQNVRSTQKYRRHYPSPSTINSQPGSPPDIYA